MINQITIEDSKTIWNTAAKQNSIRAPFYDWAWHATWHQTFTHTTPLVLLVDDVVIAPLTRSGDSVIFSGGEEFSDYLDLIGSEEKKLRAWQQILPFLKKEGITQILLHNVPENSQTLQFFQKLPHATVTREDTTPKMALPSSWDLYKDSLARKYRHELERKIRKFEREYPGTQIVESTNPKEDVQSLFTLMEKDAAKKKFLTSEIKTFFTKISHSDFSLSLLFCEVAEKKVAATYAFVYEGTYYLYNSGFDKTHFASAGFYLKAMSIKRAIEKGLHGYNFLQGPERYKYELGGIDFGVYTIASPL